MKREYERYFGGHEINWNRWKQTVASFTLIYRVENRHRLGTDIAPQDLGFEAGYAGLTATPFSDIGWPASPERQYSDNIAGLFAVGSNKTPKLHLVDTGLAASLLCMGPIEFWA